MRICRTVAKALLDSWLVVCRATMLRTLDHKLIRRPGGTSELYDLRQAPRELNNVYDDLLYADVRAELESRMLDWDVHTADVTRFHEEPRGVPSR